MNVSIAGLSLRKSSSFLKSTWLKEKPTGAGPSLHLSFSTGTMEATPVMASVPDGPVRAQLVALQLVEGMLSVGVLSRLQLLGCQVCLLLKAFRGCSCHLRQRSASEGPQARGESSHCVVSTYDTVGPNCITSFVPVSRRSLFPPLYR